MCPVSRGAPDRVGRSHPHAIIVLSSDSSSDDEGVVLPEQADAAEPAPGRAAGAAAAHRERAPGHAAAPEFAQQAAGRTSLSGRAAAAQMPVTWKQEDDNRVGSGPEVVPEPASAPDFAHAPAQAPEGSRGPRLPPRSAPMRDHGSVREAAHAAPQQEDRPAEVERPPHGSDGACEMIDVAASDGERLPSDDEEDIIGDAHAQWAQQAPSEAAAPQAAAPREPGNAADTVPAGLGHAAQLHAAAGPRSPAAAAAAGHSARKRPRGFPLPGRLADAPRGGGRAPKPAAGPVPARKARQPQELAVQWAVARHAMSRGGVRDCGEDDAPPLRPPWSGEEFDRRLKRVGLLVHLLRAAVRCRACDMSANAATYDHSNSCSCVVLSDVRIAYIAGLKPSQARSQHGLHFTHLHSWQVHACCPGPAAGLAGRSGGPGPPGSTGGSRGGGPLTSPRHARQPQSRCPGPRHLPVRDARDCGLFKHSRQRCRSWKPGPAAPERRCQPGIAAQRVGASCRFRWSALRWVFLSPPL